MELWSCGSQVIQWLCRIYRVKSLAHHCKSSPLSNFIFTCLLRLYPLYFMLYPQNLTPCTPLNATHFPSCIWPFRLAIFLTGTPLPHFCHWQTPTVISKFQLKHCPSTKALHYCPRPPGQPCVPSNSLPCAVHTFSKTYIPWEKCLAVVYIQVVLYLNEWTKWWRYEWTDELDLKVQLLSLEQNNNQNGKILFLFWNQD